MLQLIQQCPVAPPCCPGVAGGTHVTDQLCVLPAGCIADPLRCCEPGALLTRSISSLTPEARRRMLGGAVALCAHGWRSQEGGAADSPSQPCHGRCALGGSRCSLSPGAVKNTAPDFNTAAISGATSGWEQEVKPHGSRPCLPLAAPWATSGRIQAKRVYLKPSSRAPAFTFWAFQRSRRMARSPSRSTAPYLNTSL